MKELKQITAFVLLAFFAIEACSIADKRDASVSDEVWMQELKERDIVLGDLMKTITMVETSLEDIKLREELLILPPSEEIPAEKREKMLYDISLINALLMDNRNKLHETKMELIGTGIAAEALKFQIEQLNTVLLKREKSIDSVWTVLRMMDPEIAKLNENLDSLGHRIIENEILVVKQEVSLNEAYFTMGSRKQLRKKGVISDGIVIPGFSPSINPDLDNTTFTRIDIRKIRHIPVHSKKAKLLSRHSDDSFKWKREGDSRAVLEIINPEKFWKGSRYLIIETP